ncbi:MAG: hypothetical protein ACLP01_10965 [Solirubrobacteraceae bacterium]
MDTSTSTVTTLPLQGDYAAGVRTNRDARGARGTFATGMSGSTARLVRHHGDFAAGIRSHLHLNHAVPGDFASRARISESPVPA